MDLQSFELVRMPGQKGKKAQKQHIFFWLQMAPDGSSISSPFCVAKTPLCHGLSGLSQGPRAPGKDKQALPFDCKALLQGSLGHSLGLHDL